VCDCVGVAVAAAVGVKVAACVAVAVGVRPGVCEAVRVAVRTAVAVGVAPLPFPESPHPTSVRQATAATDIHDR
jgi:hypothetical protein